MSDLAFDPIEVRAEITRVTDEALLIADELADQALRPPSDPLTRNAAADYRQKRTLIRRLRRMLIADGRGQMVALHSLEAETMLAEQELDRISRRSLRNRADKAMLERAQIRVRQLRAKRAAEKKAKP